MKIAFCIPSRETVHVTFTQSLTALIKRCALEGIETSVFFEIGSILPEQRNLLAQAALKDQADYLLWLDTDMIVPSNLIKKLLSHKVDIVAANYSTKYKPRRSVAFLDDTDLDKRLEKTTGLHTVDAVGFGAILISKKVFEDLKMPYFNFEYNYNKNTFTGEDIYFCKRARAAGYKIYIDADISNSVAHCGLQAFVLKDNS